MKVRITWLAILCLALAVPASAQYLYNNGPINGTTDAWTINFGYIVSDSFNLTAAGTVTGFDFGVWEFPGDKLSSVDWSITTEENGGTVFGSGTVSGANLTDTFISSNQYGYNIDWVTASGLNLYMGAGTYWLNLQNAVVPSGNPVYWDENDGPSQASESSLGTIPSEAFDVSGASSCTIPPGGCGCLGAPACTPEPGTILLFGSGVLGLAAMLRRKLR